MRSRRTLLAPAVALALLGGAAAVYAQQEAQQEADAPPSEDAPARETATVEEGQPRYLSAMRRELEAMRLRETSCEAADAERAQCRFSHRGISTNRDYRVEMVYSDRTDTIYMYVPRFIVAPADADTTPAVLRRLMELNWTLLVGKLEWDPTDGEVRLAMVLNTDSNFDRRSFRSAVRGIGQLADRYYNELLRLQRGRGSRGAEAAP